MSKRARVEKLVVENKRPRVEKAPVEDVESDFDDSDVEDALEASAVPAEASSAFSSSFINNIVGLQRALGEVKSDFAWVERLEVVSAEALTASPDDDLKMELGFYGQALAAVTAARSELDRLNIPHRRPDDYFAEMLKTDDHMKKVKDRLIFEQKKITAVEARKKEKTAGQYAKAVAAERQREKSSVKRNHTEVLKQWRKHGDAIPEGGKEQDFEAMFAQAHTSSKKPFAGRASPKDKKFGFGGDKRMRKENTARSSRDDRSFSMGRNKALPPGVKPAKGFKPKNAGGSRPGKTARHSNIGKARRS